MARAQSLASFPSVYHDIMARILEQGRHVIEFDGPEQASAMRFRLYAFFASLKKDALQNGREVPPPVTLRIRGAVIELSLAQHLREVEKLEASLAKGKAMPVVDVEGAIAKMAAQRDARVAKGWNPLGEETGPEFDARMKADADQEPLVFRPGKVVD